LGTGFKLAVLLAGLALVSCRSNPGRQVAIAEAYVGPAVLNLRDQLAARARVVATVQHGERLEILERRRRFCKVRTAGGVEGWTDGRQLLDEQQMHRLLRLAERATAFPSQGKVMPLDLLNVHTEPNRQAPSFFQLEEGELAEVIAQRVMPRVPYTGKSPVQKDGPMAANGQPAPSDDWMLLRLHDGRAGWVLMRMLAMAIPEEVGQYAEGHFITSYFSLGEVKTEKGDRSHWLWTTRASPRQSYDFDSFRVFVFGQRRKRYETAYIERNLKGYYPVTVTRAATETASARYLFRLICQGKDGALHRRTYEFADTRVRLLGREPWQLEFVEDIGMRGREEQ